MGPGGNLGGPMGGGPMSGGPMGGGMVGPPGGSMGMSPGPPPPVQHMMQGGPPQGPLSQGPPMMGIPPQGQPPQGPNAGNAGPPPNELQHKFDNVFKVRELVVNLKVGSIRAHAVCCSSHLNNLVRHERLLSG